MRRAPFAVALLAFAPFASAQKTEGVRVGASVSAIYFSQKRLRDAFGDPAISYGANLTALTRPRPNKLAFAYDIVSVDKGDNRLFLLPFTAGYEKQFADRDAKVLPYARLEGGVSYYDVAIHDGGWDKSFKSYGAVGGAEVGIILNKTFSLKAKYYVFQPRSGVNMSGAQIGVTYNFVGL